MLGSAAIVAGGSLLGGAMESRSQEDINEANIAFAKRNTLYQTHMSNTAYQRAVEDMKAAGINPMMAATKGGASTPSGMTPKLENPKRAVAQGFANAARAIGMEVPMNEANIKNTDSSTKAKDAQTSLTAQEEKNRKLDAENIKVQNALMKEERKIKQSNAKVVAADARIAENAADRSDMRNLPVKAVAPQVKKAVEPLQKSAAYVNDKAVAGVKWIANKVKSAGDSYGAGHGAVYGGKNSAKSMKSH